MSPPAASSVYLTDKLCLGCGYNLRGLAVGSACPECGRVARREPPDVPLAQMPLEVIRHFRTWLWVATSALLAGIVVTLARPLLVAVPLLYPLLCLAAAFIWVIAWWALTAAQLHPSAASRGFGHEGRVRWLVRVSALAWLVYGGLILVNEQVGGVHYAAIYGALLAGLASISVGAILIERLAVWASDDLADELSRWLLMGLPAYVVLVVIYPMLPNIGLLGALLGLVRLIMLPALALFILPATMILLSRSMSYVVLHAIDHAEREEQRELRRQADAEAIARAVKGR